MNATLRMLVVAATLLLTTAASSAAASWRLAQPDAPAPPPGASAAPFPVPLGAIGDLQFQSPSRALLATAGSAGSSGLVKEGLYRWDGQRWSEFSTVCSAPVQTAQQAPRIIWAGPQEFWTIAFPAAPARDPLNLDYLTLCHFKNGAVIASYATAATDRDRYRPMYGGACNGPADCWFGGAALDDKPGAFHLHWDGSELRIVTGPQGRPILDMATYRGKVYEVTTVSGSSDPALLTTDEEQPLLIHTIDAVDGTPRFTSEPFVAADYPDGADPNEIDPDTGDYFPFVADGPELSALDPSDEVLWAGGGQTVSGPDLGFLEPRFARGPVLAAKVLDAPFAEVPLTDPRLNRRGLTIVDIAALPDRTAWLAFTDPESPVGATVARVDLTGNVLDYAVLPLADDPDPNTIGSQTGRARRIDCISAERCWLATDAGWLYRLGDWSGTIIDDDPFFNTFISTRPADATSVVDLSDEIPADNSGADLPPQLPQYLTVAEETAPAVVNPPRAKSVKVKVIGRTRIQITFRLTKRAKVKLRLLHRSKVVAQTKRKTLTPGQKRFAFTVSPRRWPTRIKLDVDQP